MAKLTAAARRALPKSEFAIPGRFPLNNPSHDRAAIRDAPIALHAGTISKAQEKTIINKAKRRLQGK